MAKSLARSLAHLSRPEQLDRCHEAHAALAPRQSFFKALSREKPPAKRRTDADFESFRSILGEGIPMMEIK